MPRTQRRPITAEDLAAIAVVDRPRLSPDGETVAFTLTKPDVEARTYRSAIWTVPYAGGAPRQLTNGTGRDRAASWSPDGRFIVYWENTGFEWVLPLTGDRKPFKLMTDQGSHSQISPDGKQVAAIRTQRSV